MIAGSGSALAQSRAIAVEPRPEVAAPAPAPAPVVEAPKVEAPVAEVKIEEVRPQDSPKVEVEAPKEKFAVVPVAPVKKVVPVVPVKKTSTRARPATNCGPGETTQPPVERTQPRRGWVFALLVLRLPRPLEGGNASGVPTAMPVAPSAMRLTRPLRTLPAPDLIEGLRAANFAPMVGSAVRARRTRCR